MRPYTLIEGVDELEAAIARVQEPGGDDVASRLTTIASIAENVRAGVATPMGVARMCLEASRAARTLLAAEGVEFEILGGDVTIAERDTLEHYVLAQRTSTPWLVVDFTASQLPWFARDPVVALVEPSAEALRRALETSWHWWFAR